MSTIHMLTVRTHAALGRLATLQKRAGRLTAEQAAVVRPALKELTEALEALQVANEQLHRQIDELAQVHTELEHSNALMEELFEAVPVGCLWTGLDGTIERANYAAASLLNVSAVHLTGRPLMLFTLERQAFTDALNAMREGLTTTVAITVTFRPRERRARKMELTGRKLAHSERFCWFIRELDSEDRRGPAAVNPVVSTQE